MATSLFVYYKFLTRQAWLVIIPLIAEIFLLTGCQMPRAVEAEIPVRQVSTGSGEAEIALIFLPGRGDRMEAFVEAGLLADLEAAGVAADVWLVDAHMGYYLSRTLDVKMAETVFPQLDNYREVWVVGISLGAMGAVLLEAEAPGRWDRMILLGPFVGNKSRFFSRTGIAERSRLPIDEAVGPEHLRRFWNWVIEQSNGAVDPQPQVWAAWGQSDRFEPYQEYLRGYLELGNVLVVPGGHDWETWRLAWQQLLPRLRDAQ
jgi:pimeloyl-ACP methyl ester carboxylesterase